MIDKFRQHFRDMIGKSSDIELENEDESIERKEMNYDEYNDNNPLKPRIAHSSDNRKNNEQIGQQPFNPNTNQREGYGRNEYPKGMTQSDEYSMHSYIVGGGQPRDDRYNGNGYPNRMGSIYQSGNETRVNAASESRRIDNILDLISELSEKIDVVSMNVQGIGSIAKVSSASARDIQKEMHQLAQLSSVISSQDSTIRTQHNASAKFNEDVLYKTQKSLIMELIGIADEIRMIINNKREDESYDLMEALHDLEESVEASLSNNSVRRFRESEYDDVTLDRRRQAVIGRETTTDSTLDSHYKSVSPGYEWTMPYVVISSEAKFEKVEEENRVPKMFSFVIRPEEVVKLKYEAEKSDNADAGETTDERKSTEDRS